MTPPLHSRPCLLVARALCGLAAGMLMGSCSAAAPTPLLDRADVALGADVDRVGPDGRVRRAHLPQTSDRRADAPFVERRYRIDFDLAAGSNGCALHPPGVCGRTRSIVSLSPVTLGPQQALRDPRDAKAF